MKRFDRLRKTARFLAKEHGHILGYWEKLAGTKYRSRCIYCLEYALICDASDIRLNQYPIFNHPHDISPIVATKLMLKLKEELQIELYGPNQSGYVYGKALSSFCLENPFTIK